MYCMRMRAGAKGICLNVPLQNEQDSIKWKTIESKHTQHTNRQFQA